MKTQMHVPPPPPPALAAAVGGQCTMPAATLRRLLDAIWPVAEDTICVFSEAGALARTVDPARVTLVQAEVAPAYVHMYGNRPFSIPLDVDTLRKLIPEDASGDVTLQCTRDHTTIHHTDGSAKLQHKGPTLSEALRPRLPKGVEHNASGTVDTKLVNRALHVGCAFTDNVAIVADKVGTRFEFEGVETEACVTIPGEGEGRSLFSIDYLLGVTKAIAPWNDAIRIDWGTDMPVKLSSTNDGEVSATYWLAPRTEA